MQISFHWAPRSSKSALSGVPGAVSMPLSSSNVPSSGEILGDPPQGGALTLRTPLQPQFQVQELGGCLEQSGQSNAAGFTGYQ